MDKAVTEVTTPDPVSDVRRLTAVAGYDLTSPALRAQLDAIAHRAATTLDMPVGLVSIVLDSAQFLAGRYGVGDTWFDAADGTPVEWSFCAQVVRSGEPYVVADAVSDPLQHDNPLVTLDGVASYAGAPLVDPDGQVLGSCCVIGDQKREFLDSQLEDLRVLARDVVAVLEEHRLP